MTGKRRHKSRELSRSKRKKEERQQWATLGRSPVVSAAPQPTVSMTLESLETAQPITQPEPVARGTANLMTELKKVGLYAVILLTILVVLALILG